MPPKKSSAAASRKSKAPIALPSPELYVEMVFFLLQNGQGSIPKAAREGKVDILRELGRVGVDLNAAHDGEKAVAVAVESGRLEAVEALLEAKASPDVFGQNGWSASLTAVDVDRADVLQALIGAGAKLDLHNEDELGRTPLTRACFLGKKECVSELLKAKASVNFARKDLCTPLTLAAQEGHLEIVEALIGAKAEVNAQNKNGATALLLCCVDGHSQVAKVLIGAGAGANLPDNENRTPLWAAALYGHLDCVETLIDAKCCVLTPNKDGLSPIYVAAENGHCGVIRALLKANANAQTPEKTGYTPLHMAAQEGHDEAIKVLVMEGQAQLRVVDDDGKRPLECAEEGSTTHALLTEMELTGADEHVLIKSATKRFRPLVLDE